MAIRIRVLVGLMLFSSVALMSTARGIPLQERLESLDSRPPANSVDPILPDIGAVNPRLDRETEQSRAERPAIERDVNGVICGTHPSVDPVIDAYSRGRIGGGGFGC
jgi:hypothetical protein